METSLVKLGYLIILCCVTFLSPVVGATIAVVIVANQLYVKETMVAPVLKPSRLNVSEQLRKPKSHMPIPRSTDLPPMDLFSGDMPTTVEQFDDKTFFPY